MTTNKPTRYDWQRVSQETSQALIQAIHEFDQASVPDEKEYVQVKKLLEQARYEAAVCECSLPERTVLQRAKEYHHAVNDRLGYREKTSLENLKCALEHAFRDSL